MGTNSSPPVPKLRFPEFREQSGWQRGVMQNYLSESRVRGSGGDEAKKLTVKLWGKGVVEKRESIRGSANTQYYRRRAGQFIYSKLDFLNQAFGIVPAHLDGFESTVDLPCFDIESTLIAGFLLEYVQREQFYKIIGESADGSRKAKRIQVETFLESPIYVPTKPEQQKIADCFSSLDELLDAESRKLEGLRKYKQGLMQQLFPEEGESVPRLRFPEFREAGEWRTQKVNSILTKQAEAATLAEDGSYREIGVRSHGKGLIHKERTTGKAIGSKRVFHVVPGALVINIVFAWEQALAVTTPDELGYIASHRFPMFIPKADRCDVRFIQRLFLMPFGKELLKVASPGGAGRNRTLNQTEFENLDLLIPQLAEQRRIADCLFSIDMRVASHAKKLAVLQQRKQGLLQQLFPSLEEKPQ